MMWIYFESANKGKFNEGKYCSIQKKKKNCIHGYGNAFKESSSRLGLMLVRLRLVAQLHAMPLRQSILTSDILQGMFSELSNLEPQCWYIANRTRAGKPAKGWLMTRSLQNNPTRCWMSRAAGLYSHNITKPWQSLYQPLS